MKNDRYKYDANYAMLIKEEMHRLWDLSEKVPMCRRAEIYSMGNALQAMLQEIKLNEYFIQYGY